MAGIVDTLKRKYYVCLVISLLSVFVSCSIFGPEPESGTVQDISAKVLWSTSSNSGSTLPLVEKDGIIYFPLDTVRGLKAVNADTGMTVWEDTSHGGGDSAANFFDNGQIGELSGAGYYLYNQDGSFDKFIRFSPVLGIFAGQPVANGNSVYFGTDEFGMCRFDIETDPVWDGTQWVVTPEMLYPTPPDSDGDNDISWYPPAIHDGVLYSGVYPIWAHPGTFFAVDLSTKEVNWETTGDYLRAWSFWPLIYLNDKLVDLDPFGFGIIDPETGKIEVEHGVYYGGGYDAGGFIYKNRVYFTNGSTSDNEDTPNNVICIDLDTGNAVWMQSFPNSHGSNPVCYKGLTYVFSQDCMRVLDADTGKLLGVDNSIHGDAWQLCNVLLYKDTAIVKHSGAVYSVKLNFRTDGKGKLWQEN